MLRSKTSRILRPDETSDQRFSLCHREGKGWDLLPGVVTLDATGIAWANEQTNTHLDFAAVQRIFLWVAQEEGSAPTWYCGISGGGRRVSIGSSDRSCRTKDGEAQYRDFVLALHRRLSTCAHPIEFVTLPKVRRKVVWLFLAGLAAFVGLVIVIPSVTGIAGDSLALWIPLLIALLVYEIALGFKRREKQYYSPSSIPDPLLP
jgi:hypothetical protein